MSLLLIALATASLADVVDPEPERCPDGSRGITSHAGAWCEATDCSDDPEVCNEDEACEEVSLCIETISYQAGGNWGDSAEPPTYTSDVAHGTCRTDANCSEGTCQTAMRCVQAGALKQTCGCTSAQPAGLGALALLALGLISRRRLRPSRRG